MGQDRSFSELYRGWLLPLLMGILLFAMSSIPLDAQETSTTPVETNISADDVNRVARELWCPLCSGVRLDSCELKACDQMKDVIAIKLSQGEDTQSIRDYFVEQYGPQVLGEPPRSGFNLLAWFLPIIVVIGGGLFLLIRTRRMVEPALQSASSGGEHTGSQDEYTRRLDEELSRYD